METRQKLFTHAGPFYKKLIAALATADEAISMMYYAFDEGEWADRISRVLCEKASAGVQVRLMVDEIGLLLEEPRHARLNQLRVQALRAAGVRVDIFKPNGKRLNYLNRLHIKVCAIDDRLAFIGGSNIADHYLEWNDQNLLLEGSLEGTFHQLYNYVFSFSKDGAPAPQIQPSKLTAGDARVWLTVPKQRCDIRRALLDLILEAEEAIYIRNWYFLPDQEILDALRSQAENGVKVYVLLSHRTRVRPVDLANRIHCHKLAKSGGEIHRYTQRYMHAKVVWNDSGKVLFGSANMDAQAMRDNFECSVVLENPELVENLRRSFVSDLQGCVRQTPAFFRRRSLPSKTLSYACNLASGWL